ncbi:hypothetical protein MRX96_036354 [Rhipicephalus microplus]
MRQQAALSLSGKSELSVRLRVPASDGSPDYMYSSQKDIASCGNDDSRSSNDYDENEGSAWGGPEHLVESLLPNGERKPSSSVESEDQNLNSSPYYPCWNVSQGATAGPPEAKDKQDESQNKMVLFSAKDDFVLSQDLCAMCGSFGRAEEGRLIACAQCGQCYHPYCVNVKVTKIILKKGWRCLDCTVCEGCGQPHDESRLLLCDECDISYHTYCLSPPLETVPQGNWKCRWCVVCVKCGATEPGNGSQWQNNYTQCGPCWSATTCPLCLLKYKESELVILCVQCERWMHGMCDQISSEEDAERCAEYGYNCPYCRPKDELPPHLLMDYTAAVASPSPPPPPPKPETPTPSPPPAPAKTVKEPEPLPVPVKQKPTVPQFYMDGVYLSETAIGGQPAASQGSTTTPPQSSLSTGLFGFRGRLSTEDSEDGSKDLMDVDVEPKMEVDEETKLTSEEVAKQDAESELKKKRQRKLQKLGIGGFVAKARSRSVSAKEQDVTLPLAGAGETSSEAALAALSGDVVAPAPEPAAEATGTTAEKPKRRRRVKKKNPLEDSFPLYLQEAFFGQSLLAASKTEQGPDMPSEDDEDSAMGRSEDNSILVLETSQGKSEDARIPSDSGAPSPALHTVGGSKRESPALHDDGTCTPIKTGSDDEDLGLKDILPHDLPQDDELMDMLMNEGDDLSKQGSEASCVMPKHIGD